MPKVQSRDGEEYNTLLSRYADEVNPVLQYNHWSVLDVLGSSVSQGKKKIFSTLVNKSPAFQIEQNIYEI